MSRISSGIAISASWLTSWRISSIGKSGARSSGPTGSPVPGCSTGCAGVGMSAAMLYQRRGSSDSLSRYFVCSVPTCAIRARITPDGVAVELGTRHACARLAQKLGGAPQVADHAVGGSVHLLAEPPRFLEVLANLVA